jgi:hypothetical protein
LIAAFPALMDGDAVARMADWRTLGIRPGAEPYWLPLYQMLLLVGGEAGARYLGFRLIASLCDVALGLAFLAVLPPGVGKRLRMTGAVLFAASPMRVHLATLPYQEPLAWALMLTFFALWVRWARTHAGSPPRIWWPVLITAGLVRFEMWIPLTLVAVATWRLRVWRLGLSDAAAAKIASTKIGQLLPQPTRRERRGYSALVLLAELLRFNTAAIAWLAWAGLGALPVGLGPELTIGEKADRALSLISIYLKRETFSGVIGIWALAVFLWAPRRVVLASDSRGWAHALMLATAAVLAVGIAVILDAHGAFADQPRATYGAAIAAAFGMPIAIRIAAAKLRGGGVLLTTVALIASLSIGVILLDRKQAEPVWRDPQVALAQAEYRITGDGRSLRVGVVAPSFSAGVSGGRTWTPPIPFARTIEVQGAARGHTVWRTDDPLTVRAQTSLNALIVLVDPSPIGHLAGDYRPWSDEELAEIDGLPAAGWHPIAGPPGVRVYIRE